MLRRPFALALALLLAPTAVLAHTETTFTFTTGSVELDDAGGRAVDALAEQLIAEPTANVVIEGHADTTGSAAINARVARQRAERAAARLQQRGIAAARITIEAFGSARPATSNDTAEGRAQNRRVVVVVETPPAPVAVVAPPVIVPVVVEPAPPAPVEAPPPVVVAEAAAVAPDPVEAAPAPVEALPVVAASEPAWPKWIAVIPASVGVVAAAGSIAFLVDANSTGQRLAINEAQLERDDLRPEVRTSTEAHRTMLNDAFNVDLGVGIGLGVVAVAGITTAIVLVATGE